MGGLSMPLALQPCTVFSCSSPHSPLPSLTAAIPFLLSPPTILRMLCYLIAEHSGAHVHTLDMTCSLQASPCVPHPMLCMGHLSLLCHSRCHTILPIPDHPAPHGAPREPPSDH